MSKNILLFLVIHVLTLTLSQRERGLFPQPSRRAMQFIFDEFRSWNMRRVCLMILAVVAIDPLNLRAQEMAKSKCSVTFAEVPPSESKITWVHDNGRSEAHHLPETCGGGGLVLDYDHDGWRDVYLVNSHASAFVPPMAPRQH